MISQRQMGVLIAGGDVEPIERMADDGIVRVVGHRATKPIRRSDGSPACLNAATMQAITGGKAQEPGDTRDLSRAGVSQLHKFRLWSFEGDDRAVRVRPRPSAIESGYLESLLAAGVLKERASDRLQMATA